MENKNQTYHEIGREGHGSVHLDEQWDEYNTTKKNDDDEQDHNGNEDNISKDDHKRIMRRYTNFTELSCNKGRANLHIRLQRSLSLRCKVHGRDFM